MTTENIENEITENDQPENEVEIEVPKDQWKADFKAEYAQKVFGKEYSELSEEQVAIVDEIVSKMRKPRKSTKKDTVPKRTSGRMIAPTLRVKDEDAILEAIYTLRASVEEVNFTGGWGATAGVPKATKTMKPIFIHLASKLQDIVDERKIADDTTIVEISE